MDEIEVPVWYKSGGMLYRRDALEPTHPESTYNYIKNTFNVNPEDYGFYCTVLTDDQISILNGIPSWALQEELNRRFAALEQESIFG